MRELRVWLAALSGFPLAIPGTGILSCMFARHPNSVVCRWRYDLLLARHQVSESSGFGKDFTRYCGIENGRAAVEDKAARFCDQTTNRPGIASNKKDRAQCNTILDLNAVVGQA